MSRVVVDGRVRVPLSGFRESELDAVREFATHDNPSYGKPRHEGEPPTVRTWRHEGDYLTVPRGLLSGVLGALRVNPGSLGTPEVEDRRTWSYPEPGFPGHRVVLRDYQEELVGAALAGEQGLLRASTGSGKTSAAFGLLARLKRRSLVVLWSAGLLKQWRDRAVEELGMDPEDVGIVQGDETKIRPLTLAMQQTMHSRFSRGDLSLAHEFDVVVMDEVQRAPADTAFAAIDPLSARYRVGVSADETRRDEMEFVTRDLFGSVLAEVPEERVVRSGAVVDVEVAVVPTTFEAPWYRYRQDFNKLLDKMTEDEDRNRLILSLVRSAVSSGEQVIVFTHRVEHARWLDVRVAEMGIPGGLMLGGVSEAEEFDRTKARLRDGRLRVAVGTYGAIGEGIDVPAVARGIAATPMHNNKQKIGQVRGRLCRSAIGKTCGRLAYLADVEIYGRRKAVANFVEWFRNVKVWDGGRWVDGRSFLASLRSRAA